MNKNSNEIQKLLRDALPENSWLIDENIKFVKQLNDYNSIIEDLEFAEYCLEELEKIRNNEKETKTKKNRALKKVYFTNSVVTYARCFNYTKKHGRITIDQNQFKKYFPNNVEIKVENFIEFHNYIMELRNKFISHADKNIYELNRVYINFRFEKEYLHSTFSNLSISMFNFDQTQLSNFMILIKYLINVIKLKIETLTQKLKNEIGNEKLLETALKIKQK